MASSDIPTIILAIVALYGAVLSTVNFFRDRKREKNQIIVNVDWEWDEEDIGGIVLRAVAKNIGTKTVTLDYVTIEEFFEPERSWFIRNSRNDKKKKPKSARYEIKTKNELSSGKSYEEKIDARELKRETGISNDINVIAIFVDQIGNKYKSKPLRSSEFMFSIAT